MGPRFIASLSLLLALAAGGLLWLSGQDFGGADATTSEPTTSAKPPPVPTDVKCPSSTSAPDGPSDLPAHPVVVRLCAGPGIATPMPADALTEGIASVVAAINGQKAISPPDACNLDLGAGYILAFRYRDGSTAYATGMLYGCHVLTVGHTVYADARAPLTAFTAALWRQRAGGTPPTDVHAPRACSAPSASLVAKPAQIELGRLCLANGAHRGTAMTPSQVQEVVHDWATGGSGHAMAPLSCRSNADWRLEGVTAWGDPVQLASVCGLFTDDNGNFWHPSPSVQQLLTTLEARAA